MASANTKKKIIALGKFLFEHKYIVASDGNISARVNNWEMLITRSGVCKGELSTNDIVKLNLKDWNLEDKIYPLKPSSEYRMHSAIYLQRPDVNAVIHAHPALATTFAVTGRKLNVNLLTETAQTLGVIKYLGYYPPGSVELANAVRKAVIKHNVIILGNHGVVVCGQDLTDARFRLERLEFLAKVTLLVTLIQ
ncbi:MAG: class II aldolase/adducin family protein [candidate division WOR-3 bacterium]|nr:class II aldolase/adducin family protein [candidate division WOR-3 bacterium]